MDVQVALSWLLPCLPFGLAAYGLLTGGIPVRRWLAPDGKLRRSEQPLKFWIYIAVLTGIGALWLSAAG